jgi:hypothetical protein
MASLDLVVRCGRNLDDSKTLIIAGVCSTDRRSGFVWQ